MLRTARRPAAAPLAVADVEQGVGYRPGASSQRSRRVSVSNRRALSIAAAGGRRQGQGQLLVLGAELHPVMLLGQVEIAEHLVTDADGDTEEAPHRRVMQMETHGPLWSASCRSRSGLGSVDELAKDPTPGGRCPILSTVTGSIPECTNWVRVRSSPTTPRAAYSAPISSRASSTMRLQQTGQIEISSDALGRPEQPTQPPLGAKNVVRSLDQLLEQLIKLEARHRRKGERLLPRRVRRRLRVGQQRAAGRSDGSDG